MLIEHNTFGHGLLASEPFEAGCFPFAVGSGRHPCDALTMGKATYQGPADRLAHYEQLVASVEGVERKGAANPYTSRNGYMTSFIDKEGATALRFSKADQAAFIERYDSRIPVQYGRDMPDFAVVPDELLERPDELRQWFVRSWEFVGTLEPK